MTLHVQFVTMEWMLVCGILISALFDLYRVLAGELRFPRFTLPFLDLLYWALSTLLVFRALYESNYGQVRLFVFLALMIGVSAYFAFLSLTMIRIHRWLIRMVKKLLRFLQHMFNVLVIRPVLAVYKLIVWILGLFLTVSIFLGRVMLQLLYPVRLLCRVIVRFIKRWVRMPKAAIAGWNRIKRWLRS